MSDAQIYEDDLSNRFPTYTFNTTVTGGATNFEALDGATVIDSQTRGDLFSAVFQVRSNLVGGYEIDPLLTSAQRDAFSVGGVPETVQTTDNTITTIATIAIPDESISDIHANIVGIEDDNSERAVYEVIQTAYRTGGGSAILMGSMTTVHEAETNASWGGASFSVSGNNLLVEVKGISVTTIDWQVTYFAETKT